MYICIVKIAGFSFIRNAVTYDYPIVEALQSILPVCDEIYVAVGKSEDNTVELVANVDRQKIKIVETVWDESLREGGKVLALETNKAFQAIPNEYDWCFYIQGDEVFHENGLEKMHGLLKSNLDNYRVEGFLVDYLHHYGSYDYIATSRNWYRNEIRVIRNNKEITSWKDAQGFRWHNERKLAVKSSGTVMHHYGWVKNPEKQVLKQKNFSRYWHDDKWLLENTKNSFDYSEIDYLELFKGTHPKMMERRISEKNWKFEYDLSKDKRTLRVKCLDTITKYTGISLFEYKNYRLIR